MRYIENINFNNTQTTVPDTLIDGPWTYNSYQFYNSTSIASNATNIVNVSNYLPNDGYDYELLIYSAASTGGTNGNTVRLKIGNDASPDNDLYSCGIKVQGANVAQTVWCQSHMVLTTSRNIKIWNTGSATCTTWISILGYKRIGYNKHSEDRCNWLHLGNEDYLISHKDKPQRWFNSTYYEVGKNTSIAVNAYLDYDISSFLPADGYNYELMVNHWVWSPSGANAYTELQIRDGSNDTLWIPFGAKASNNGDSQCCSHAAILPLLNNNRILRIRNVQGSTSTSWGVAIIGYRRLNKIS